MFVTGQKEVRTLCDWLTRAYPARDIIRSSVSTKANEKKDSVNTVPRGSSKTKKQEQVRTEAESENIQVNKKQLVHRESEKMKCHEDDPSNLRFNLDK